MKRVLASVTALLAVAAFRPAPSTAQASVGHDVDRGAPLTFSEFVSCANNGAGEWVDVSGEVNTVFHVTQSAAENWRMNVNTSSHGTGTGQTSGSRYVFNGGSRSELFVGNPLPFSGLFAFKEQLVGRGSGNNLWLYFNAHVVFNANGELTSNVNDVHVTCK